MIDFSSPSPFAHDPDPGALAMETMLEAIRRLRTAGYQFDLSADVGGRLRCGGCGELVDAHEAIVEETVRFEGTSNPDDQAILSAVLTPCGHRGLFSAAYGLYVSRDAMDVLHALSRR
jgi:hypothetical protein